MHALCHPMNLSRSEDCILRMTDLEESAENKLVKHQLVLILGGKTLLLNQCTTRLIYNYQEYCIFNF